jgi:hypothetical protein
MLKREIPRNTTAADITVEERPFKGRVTRTE